MIPNRMSTNQMKSKTVAIGIRAAPIAWKIVSRSEKIPICESGWSSLTILNPLSVNDEVLPKLWIARTSYTYASSAIISNLL